MMLRPSFRLLPWIFLLFPALAAAQDGDALVALRDQDARLARIAEPLLAANHELCRREMPLTGMVIHSRDQYGDEAQADFTNGAIAIEAVLGDSPAQRAGLRAGEAILALAGEDLTGLQPVPPAPVRDAVFDKLSALPAAEPIVLSVSDGNAVRSVMLHPVAGCRALVEVLADQDLVARSDGRVIQLSLGIMQAMSDDAVAAIMGHEMAHLVLEHRRRLSEAGVSKGALGELGSNQQRNRQAEVEADRLSVHLLANAGYDPQVAVRFWLSDEGRQVDKGLLRSFIYPSPRSRAEIMQREMEMYLPSGRGPTWPGHLLARRDEDF